MVVLLSFKREYYQRGHERQDRWKTLTAWKSWLTEIPVWARKKSLQTSDSSFWHSDTSSSDAISAQQLGAPWTEPWFRTSISMDMNFLGQTCLYMMKPGYAGIQRPVERFGLARLTRNPPLKGPIQSRSSRYREISRNLPFPAINREIRVFPR